MAKTAPPRNKSGNGTVAESGPEAPESLEQVRDILFGGQMRTVDARLRGLEERLLHDQSVMRDDLTRRLTDLEEAIRKELAGQAERLTAERAKRADDQKALAAELKEAFKNIERRHLKLEEAASLGDAELRDQLLKLSAGLSAELGRTAERFSTDLDKSATALRAEKLDTSVLATAFTEMASRLSGGGRPAGKGTSRG